MILRTVSVTQSPLWSINIMNGSEMWFDDIYVNNTALEAPFGDNWVQNTDGFDTMDASNIRLTNFVYQGQVFQQKEKFQEPCLLTRSCQQGRRRDRDQASIV